MNENLFQRKSQTGKSNGGRPAKNGAIKEILRKASSPFVLNPSYG
jgi:hypothetical protein